MSCPKPWSGVAATVFFLSAAPLTAQSPGSGSYAGPSVLSRWSRMGTPAGNRGPMVKAYLATSYSFQDGLVGPVTEFNNPFLTNPETAPAGAIRIPTAGVNNAFAGGGLNVNRIDSRSAFSLGYQASYSRAFAKNANAYQGLNQDLNLNYERQLTRRWGFYTGHSGGTQTSLLGLARPTQQRNFFDQSYSAANEALDARLQYFNSGAGVFFQANQRMSFSMDGGYFAVTRTSRALASSRGERAQGEFSYRISRNQSLGAVYSFSHFYYPRGFGETYTHSVMLAMTRMLNRRWTMQLAVGPYRTESERLTSIKVDPFIAALTGQTSAIAVFHGVNQGLGASVSVGTNLRRHSLLTSYRRGIDPGNGITLTSVNDFGQASWGYQAGRNWSVGASVFVSRLNPLLESATGSANFRSSGSNMNFSYRLTDLVHLTSTFSLQSIYYDKIDVNQVRKALSIGLAFSPGEFSLNR
jgi:hypothetical protein